MASDINIPSIVEQIDVGEKFYDYALPWDKIATTILKEPTDQVGPFINLMKDASSSRIASDPGFKKQKEEIDELIKNREKRTLINLKQEKKNDEKSKE